MVTVYPLTKTLSFCLPGQQKSRKALREYPDIKEPHQRKNNSHRVSTNGVSDVRKCIYYNKDRFRFLPMEDISYSTMLGEVFLCYLFLFTCFYHEIMHPFSSCFGIFSRSKACRFSIRVCEWVPQSSPVVISRQYLQTENPAAFYDSVQLQNKMDFFFPVGFFNCPIWLKLCKLLHERVIMLSPCQSEFACQERVQCWNNLTARQLTFMLPDPFHTHTIK